jgi:predicted porin
MKKTLIAMAAVAVAGVASAQVTIDGAVELGVIKVKGTGATLNATNGASQLRFSGKEDLGGGLSATFALAQRMSLESGLADGTTQRPTFQGESTVGFASDAGSVKIGRALTAFQSGVNATDPYGTLKQASTAALTGGYATDIDFGTSGSGAGRTDAIFVNTSMGSVKVGVSIGLKNSSSSGTNTVGTNNLTSFWGSYAGGPLMVAAGMEKNRTGDKITAYLATYDLGMMKVGAGASTVNTVANTGANGKNSNVMAVFPMGAATFTYGMTDQKAGSTGAKTNKTGLGVTYALSKRTNVYSTYGSTKAKATGVTTTGYDIGVRHSF